MPEYYDSKPVATTAMNRIWQDNADRIRDATVQFEPNNGYVVVLFPALHDLSDLVEAEGCEVMDGVKRPTNKTRIEPVASPTQGAEGATTAPVKGATARVWAIADSLNEESAITRADRPRVIEACVAAGINKSTASTQWSKWAKARGI